jgi:hypothetical protein
MLALTMGTAPAQDGSTPSGGQPLAPPAVYQTFGTGCPGTGTGGMGLVLPAAFANQLAGGGNYFPFGRGDQRYQQVFLGSEVTGVKILNGLGVRQPNHSGPAGTQTIEVLLGVSSFDQATLTATYATNANVTPPQSLFQGQINVPSLPANFDPSFFPLRVQFTRPWIYNSSQGNLLVEVRNTSTSDVIHGWDAASGATVTTTRLYANPVTATTGSIGRNYGLVFGFATAGASATPRLSPTGRPILNQTFSVDLSLARASSPAILITGVSKTKWGAFNLPLDLTPLGAPGCSLLCSVELTLGLATDPAGAAKVPFSIPNTPGLVGLQWFNQFAVLDTVNVLKLVFSNGGEAIVGDS